MKKTTAFILKIIFTLLYINLAGPVSAQPAWSRGIQIVSAGHDECMLRAKNALIAEGYVNLSSGGDFNGGFKSIHAAVITCNATSDGRTYVNIFVASQSGDQGVPGAERVRLQSYMDGSISTIPSTTTVQATWTTQATTYRGKNGQRYTYTFPPGGTILGSLWGTDIYTDDSSVGLAAVHAGLISLQNGGTVTIEIRAGATSYTGSTRYGITSNSYGGWHGSFVFVR